MAYGVSADVDREALLMIVCGPGLKTQPITEAFSVNLITVVEICLL